MATETVKCLMHYPRHHDPPRTVTVEYVKTAHWNTTDPRMVAYDVVLDGEVIGTIQRALESTDRVYGRIRVPGKGRLAWGWRAKSGAGHSPGSYVSTRATAVAKILGYGYGERVK